MNTYAGRLFAATGIALLVVVAAPMAQSQTQKANQPPQMTPEQQAQMEAYQKAAQPGPQHQALAATAGSYNLKIKSWMEPGAPPMEEAGTAERSMILEGRVMQEKVNSSMMGQSFTGQGMTGYDNVTGKHWSTWTDSMSTGVMLSEGTCDAQGKNCTFTGNTTDPITKKPMKLRMTTKWPNATTEVFEMYGPGPDGKEMKMMEITYTKK